MSVIFDYLITFWDIPDVIFLSNEIGIENTKSFVKQENIFKEKCFFFSVSLKYAPILKEFLQRTLIPF